MNIFTIEKFPVAVLFALPWIAFITMIMVVEKNKSTTLVADRNRAFTCSLFLGISALDMGAMCIQGLPFTLGLFYLPASIPLLVMITACIVIITGTLKHEHRDIWLRLLVVTSILYPLLFIFFIFAGYPLYLLLTFIGISNPEVDLLCAWLIIYSGFSIITAFGWFVLKHRYKEGESV